MNVKIILSFIIPTYNRVGLLETTVDCFVKQIIDGGLEDMVEILIGNDGSKDKTSEYVNKVVKEHKFIRGWNYEKNIGMSGGIEFLVKESLGEYILIGGDDDLLRDGAIAYFIKCILEKKPNFILINTSNIFSLDESNRKIKIDRENRLEINHDIFVENFQKEYKKLEEAHNWIYLTNLLPAVISRKDLYQKELATAKKYLRPENLYLWQGQVIIGISKYGRFLVIADCFILHRKNETSWTHDKRSVVFFDIFDTVELSRLIKDYMPGEYKRYKKIYATFTMGGLLADTERGRDIRKLAWSALLRNLDCFPENIQFLSMVLAPRFINKISPKLRSYKNLLK